MPISAKDWYEPNPDLNSYYQGDIVRDVPIIFLPDKISKWLLLRPDPRAAKHIDAVLGGKMCKWLEVRDEGHLKDAWQFGKREELVAAKAQMTNVIILTQSCDIVHRDYYQIAPIYPESEQKNSALTHLRENELSFTFFLPAVAPHLQENSYANLAHTTLIPKAFFPRDKVADKLGARLTEFARTRLQEQLAYYFGRPFGFGARDKAKETAEFVCISCFYKTAKPVTEKFERDAQFTPCKTCGEARWLRVVPPGQDPQPETEPVIRKDS